LASASGFGRGRLFYARSARRDVTKCHRFSADRRRVKVHAVAGEAAPRDEIIEVEHCWQPFGVCRIDDELSVTIYHRVRDGNIGVRLAGPQRRRAAWSSSAEPRPPRGGGRRIHRLFWLRYDRFDRSLDDLNDHARLLIREPLKVTIVLTSGREACGSPAAPTVDPNERKSHPRSPGVRDHGGFARSRSWFDGLSSRNVNVSIGPTTHMLSKRSPLADSPCRA
jgi:hypothetical protein